MTHTTNLRRQHDVILALADDLVAAQESLATSAEAAGAATRLAKLTGVLQLHLAAEDRALYPRLRASSDAAVADTARRFMREMGGLAQVYGEFEARWRSASAIQANPDGFRAETAAVLGALGTRIARENAELYPLADAPAPDTRRVA
jgi:hemerythrin-like domain-containing protein